MATAVSVSDYQRYVGSKHPTPQALISTARGALIYVVEMTFDAAYATGGYTDVSLKHFGAKKVQFTFFDTGKIGLSAFYDKDADKVQFFTDAGVELANASVVPNGKTISALVFART